MLSKKKLLKMIKSIMEIDKKQNAQIEQLTKDNDDLKLGFIKLSQRVKTKGEK